MQLIRWTLAALALGGCTSDVCSCGVDSLDMQLRVGDIERTSFSNFTIYQHSNRSDCEASTQLLLQVGMPDVSLEGIVLPSPGALDPVFPHPKVPGPRAGLPAPTPGTTAHLTGARLWVAATEGDQSALMEWQGNLEVIQWQEQSVRLGLTEGEFCQGSAEAGTLACWAAENGELELWSDRDLTRNSRKPSHHQGSDSVHKTKDGTTLCL